MGKSFIKASGRAYDTKGKNFIQQSKDLKNNIPKKDMDIYDKYLKNQMENPSQKAIDSKANIQKILDKIQ